MSVRVTVHEISPAHSLDVVTNPLADLEAVRKNANEKLRIRRLVQVRQQSKEVAAKVRRSYQQAKVKELAKIEQTKQEELKAWKRKHIRQLQDEYARCIGEVGEAHKAAEAAEECAVWFEEKRAAQQAAALQRGRKAEETATRERERKEALREAKGRKKPYVPSKSIAVQASIPEPKQEPVRDAITVARDEISSTEPSLSPYEQFRIKMKAGAQTLPMVGHGASLSESEDEIVRPGGMGNKENIPSTGQDYSATAFTSPSDMRPVEQTQRQRLQPFTQITELIQQRRQQQHHRQAHDESIVEQQRAMPKPPVAGLYAGGYGTQKVVQFDDLSENTLSFPTSSVLTRDDHHRPQRENVPPMVTTDGSPRKIRPRKLVEQPKVSPVQQHQADPKATTSVPKRGQATLPSGVVPEASASSASYGASTKVQYYDYNTRYVREYDQPVGFVQREDHRTNVPTAMEEAHRYETLQQQLATARSKSAVDRTKPALEKQKTRRDYEKLSAELDKLTRSENKLKSLAVPSKTTPTETMLKQKAEARQRKATEAIENLLQQRALVTCPVVRHEPSADHRRSRSGSRAPALVNVADIRSDASAPPAAPGRNVSSDSCASITLGKLDRPGIPLPAGNGKRDTVPLDGDVDKIGRLKELLDQINEQRRLLTEELAKEQSAPILPVAPGVDELCAAMQKDTELEKLERMKRRQEELLEQQKLLQTREREVDDLERQLREKMALLVRNKQQREAEEAAPRRTASNKRVHKTASATVHVETQRRTDGVEVEVEQPLTSTSTTSSSGDGANTNHHEQSERGRDVPVKIIITVNDKSMPSKKKHRKKVPRNKSPKVVPVEPPKVTVTARNEEPMEKEKLPTPEVREDVARLRKDIGRVAEMDFSPGSTSTSSTVYRELPPKIGRLKINSVLPADPARRDATGGQPMSAPKHQLEREPIGTAKGGRPSQPTVCASGANLNPQLVKYIVRLLGMSRQSIDQLGMSSTTVSTPNASVVNASANVNGAIECPPANDSEADRVHRLRKFIDENYNFLQEIDDTLKRSDQSTVGSGDSRRMASVDDETNDVSRVEDVWMQTLRKREKVMKQTHVKKKLTQNVQSTTAVSKPVKKKKRHIDVPSQDVVVASPGLAPVPVVVPAPVEPPPVAPLDVAGSTSGASRLVTKEASLKSILKSPKRDASLKVAKIITPQGHVEIINLSDREEQEILDRYSQLTERCSQRITELSQMINQVREEKRRLVEDSISSFDQQESTKYMDLPAVIQGVGGKPHAAPPPVEERELPGASVAVGTPSPSGGAAPVHDDPMSEEIDNIFSLKQIGLSKDSGIAMSRPLTASDIRESPYEECSQGKEPLPFEPFLRDIHKPPASLGKLPQPSGPLTGVVPVAYGVSSRKPPPVAITRYSPQLDEVPVHELSTILEVDTPAVAPASSSKVYDVSSLSAAGERSDAAKESLLIEARNRLLLEPPASPNIAYDRFPDYEAYVQPRGGAGASMRVDLENTDAMAAGEISGQVRLDLTEEREPERLQYRSFPGPAPPFDITEDEPRSKGEESHSGGSDGSLPDVVAELAKMNIILKPFDHSLDNSNRSTPLSNEDESGKRNRVADDNKPPAYSQRKPPSRPRPCELELSDLLGPDLEGVSRFRWLTAMLKKNQATNRPPQQQLNLLPDETSSSSLSLEAPQETRLNQADANHDANGEDSRGGVSGKPPSLNEFIARELMIRTQSELQSLTSSTSELSSSPGAHSALLRSLWSISNLDHTSREASPAEGGALLTSTINNVQRTSTPVASKSTTGSGGGGSSSRIAGQTDAMDSGTANNHTLFSGESRISSVRLSSSSGSSEPHTHVGLSAPNLRLERQSSVSQREQN